MCSCLSGRQAKLLGSARGAGDGCRYDALRLSLGVPDGSRDLPVEKALLLESGFDELHGVDWDKGCYMGQELTARTKYRGLVKRRLFPVRVDGPLPAPGTAIQRNGQEVGEIRSGSGDRALAMLRLDAHGARRADRRKRADRARSAGLDAPAGTVRPPSPCGRVGNKVSRHFCPACSCAEEALP